MGGTAYLFTSTPNDSPVSSVRAYAVSNTGTLSLVDTVSDDATLELSGVTSLATANIAGTSYLFTGSIGGDNGISVFAIATDGTLTNTDNVSDDGTLNLQAVSSLTTAGTNGSTFLFAAGGLDSGISVFSVAANGTLTNVDNVSDDGTLKLLGASSLNTVNIGGTLYQIAAGAADDGISVFSVAANGTLTNVDNVSDTPARQLDGAWAVKTATVGGTTYVFVGGDTDDCITVFSMAANGTLTDVGTVHDDSTLQLNGVQSLATAIIDGRPHLIAAGRVDDGISVFEIADDGTLTNIANITDDSTLKLNGVARTTFVQTGSAQFLAAASPFEWVSLFSLASPDVIDGTSNADDLVGAGWRDEIRGFAGDDTLNG